MDTNIETYWFTKNIVKEFEYKGFRCFIRKLEWYKGSFHTGYIDITENDIKKDIDNYDIYNDLGFNQEITFCDWVDKRFLIGFDTNHIYNKEATKTKDYVEKEIKKMVEILKEVENEK